MPRPKRPGAPEPKRRSRNGCWPCKNRKIKCGEEHPNCLNCQRTGETCDYSIRLNWDGRRGKRQEAGLMDFGPEVQSPPVPAKGFKLVHQFPASDPQGGTRRLEPLTSPTSQPKVEPVKYYPQSAVSFVDSTPMDFDQPDSNQPPSKRVKLKTDMIQFEPVEKRPYSSHSSTVDSSSVGGFGYSAGSAVSVASPLTPTTSSTYSDDDQRQTGRGEQQRVPQSEVRRLSVNSLLAGPPSFRGPLDGNLGRAKTILSPLDTRACHSREPVFYGIDRGIPDRDLGKNDDMNVITATSPMLPRDGCETPFADSADDFPWNEFGFGVETNDSGDTDGGYYAKQVPIYIPRSLEPLPPKLMENPINLMYFHHFLNHTARVLVPYDDPHANPFRTILPQMAVKNENLLALLLAYSASHRARVLNHPEPTLRIAFWVDDIFPALRQALNDPDRNFSNANLATAIMLASLEIVSPKVFGYDIPWQKHLSLARELITVRPGGLHGFRPNFREDQVCSFLFSWASYLDVIGSLTGGPNNSWSSAWIFDYELDDIVDGYDEIDCIMGFTTRCIYLLAKIADLARKCDAERIDEDSNVLTYWEPSEEIAEQAEKLEAAVTESMLQSPVPCKHIHTVGDIEKWDRKEMEATNAAFHWAALVHLYRRVMGKGSDDRAVQTAVERIITCVECLRRGGTAESCLLFPMFTAGCDARHKFHKTLIMQRFLTMENHGMIQIHNARRIMQKVWETGKPWQTLVGTEFIG